MAVQPGRKEMHTDLKRLFGFLFLAVFGVVGAGLSALATPAEPSDATASVPASRMDVKVGDRAPEFTLPMYPQGNFTLGDQGQQTLVLYFYPGDGTPQCTQQALAFRDNLAAFQDAGAVVYGVSPDSLASHAAFTKQYGLPFPLLVDADGNVRLLYGMPDGTDQIQGRMTYVIDKDGVVRAVISEHKDMARHVEEVLTAVKSVAAQDRQRAAAH
jgi:peroxiredoxin Q/BCP